MSISINCEAKKWIVRESCLERLISLLKDKDDLVLLNTIKAIGNCAEDYRGRFQLNSACPIVIFTYIVREALIARK